MEEPLPKQSGRIKWFDQSKRHGFITTTKDKYVFVQQQQILRDSKNQPHKGQRVLFRQRYAAKGPEALSVELAQE